MLWRCQDKRHASFDMLNVLVSTRTTLASAISEVDASIHGVQDRVQELENEMHTQFASVTDILSRKLVKVQNLDRAWMHLGNLFGMSMDKVTHHMWPDRRNPDVPSSLGGLPEDASKMVG